MKHNYVFIGIAFLLALLLTGCGLLGGDDEEPFINTPGIAGDPLYQSPRWSPDGNEILYYSYGFKSIDDKSGDFKQYPDSIGIWVMDIEGKNRRMLFPDAHYANWSPDGEWIVFVLEAGIYKVPYDGNITDNSEIKALATEGRNFFPEWSPDGEWIVYDRSLEDEFGPGGIWKMRPDGSEKEHVIGGAYPSWHANSKDIAYNFQGELRLFNHDVDNYETIIQLSSPAGAHRYLQFSPLGDEIVLESESRVTFIDINTGEADMLDYGGYPSWSPDGSKIVYICAGICIMNKDGSDNRLISLFP